MLNYARYCVSNVAVYRIPPVPSGLGEPEGFVVNNVLAEQLGATPASIARVLAELVGVVPAGMTVVSPEGRVAFVNAHQTTIAGCPWLDGRIEDMRRDPAVPRPLRAALRRLAADGSLTEPVRVAPLLFEAGAEPLETWLVPVRQSAQLLGTVILQYERSAGRVVQRTPDGRAGTRIADRPALPGEHAPPALDVAKLMRVFGLTEREVQLIDALCRGHATARIARDMAITANTVKDYVKRVQRKMGATNRLTIVACALQVSLR